MRQMKKNSFKVLVKTLKSKPFIYLKGENWVPNLDISIYLYLYIKIPQKRLNVKVSSYF